MRKKDKTPVILSLKSNLVCCGNDRLLFACRGLAMHFPDIVGIDDFYGGPIVYLKNRFKKILKSH